MNRAFERAKERFAAMLEKQESSVPRWLDTIESEIEGDSREINREVLQGAIDSVGIGDIGPELIAVNGLVLNHRRIREARLHTKFGVVKISRLGYYRPGLPAIFPLDVAINLPVSSYSYGLQRFIARRVSTTAFEEVLDLTKETTGVTIGKRQALEIVQRCAVDFDAFYDDQKKSKDKRSPIMVLTTDGKGIVMRPDGLRDKTRELAEKSSKKMRTRLSRGEKTNRKRMAQVASIYLIGRFKRTPRDVVDELARREISKERPRPTNKRLWASVEKDSEDVIKSMFEEAKRRDPKCEKEWAILVDGHKSQMQLINAAVKREEVAASIILDIIHVIEYLWVTARLFFDETSSDCERWVEDKLEIILNNGVGKVAGSIRMSAAKTKLTKEQKKIAENCARYIARRKRYMDYATYLKKGYPIATGVIEGACRHLIKDRMDVTGARWSLDGAESVLKLRSIVKSGDFDNYWAFHLKQEHQRNHLSQLANIDQLRPLYSQEISA